MFKRQMMVAFLSIYMIVFLGCGMIPLSVLANSSPTKTRTATLTRTSVPTKTLVTLPAREISNPTETIKAPTQPEQATPTPNVGNTDTPVPTSTDILAQATDTPAPTPTVMKVNGIGDQIINLNTTDMKVIRVNYPGKNFITIYGYDDAGNTSSIIIAEKGPLKGLYPINNNSLSKSARLGIKIEGNDQKTIPGRLRS